MPGTKPTLRSLTGIRFFLALWVAFFHQSQPAGLLGSLLTGPPNVAMNWLRTGYVAVTAFFVLSGFILAYNYPLDRPWSKADLRRFVIARFARIYPVYCLGLIPLALLFAYRVVRFGDLVEQQKITSLLLNFGLLQSWIPHMALTWNFPGWSLSDEAFFYAAFPWIGFRLWRLSRPAHLAAAAIAIWILSLAVPVAIVAFGPSYGSAFAAGVSEFGAPPADSFWMELSKFNPAVRLPEFGMGIVACRLYGVLRDAGRSLAGRGYILYIPGLLVCGLLLANASRLPHLIVHNGLLAPFIALTIAGFALGGGPLSTLLSTRWLVFLGQASYATYILHAPWFNLLDKPWVSRWLPLHFAGWGGMAFYIATLLMLSGLVFKLFEEPASRKIKSVLKSLWRSAA